MGKTLRLGLLAGLSTMGFSVTATAASYFPSGPQTGVSLATVTSGGWTQCYDETMSVPIGNSAENVLSVCNGDLLMMAGRETGSDTFLVLAAAARSDTIIDTGQTSVTHLANGSNWWFSNFWSWGFTDASDTVDNFECDFSDSPASMCLHTFDVVGGFRINNILGLNDSTEFEKVFFVAQMPEPATLALLGLGLAGLGFSRRQH